MRRTNAVVIALMLGAAVAFGSFAALKTARVGTVSAHKSTVPHWKIAKRRHALNRMERSLRVALRTHPPRLPKVPKFAPVATPSAAPAPAPVSAPGPAAAPAPPAKIVRYVRPKPIVVTTHRSHGDDGGEAEHEDHEGHEGGGDD